MSTTNRLVDLGGGTGQFAELLYKKMKLTKPVLCVDSSISMLKMAANRIGVQCLHTGALTFVSDTLHQYDCILLKEVIHHIDDVTALYAGIYSQLTQGGICLTCTRPRVPDYPLFAAARTIWESRQPEVSEYVTAMQQAGFKVHIITGCYQVDIPAESWYVTITNRIWSIFSDFSDDELTTGIEEIRQNFVSKDGHIKFSEQMLFVVAKK
jgi:trans-aconitate methyltransferase